MYPQLYQDMRLDNMATYIKWTKLVEVLPSYAGSYTEYINSYYHCTNKTNSLTTPITEKVLHMNSTGGSTR